MPRRPNCSHVWDPRGGQNTTWEEDLRKMIAAAPTPEAKATLQNALDTRLAQIKANVANVGAEEGTPRTDTPPLNLPMGIEPMDDGTFFCTICDRGFQNLSGVKGHVAGDKHVEAAAA